MKPTRARVDTDESAVEWLERWGYKPVVAGIRMVEEKWRKSGRKTRRNWWDILAGTKAGNMRGVDGILFPVIAAARRRQGLPLTGNELEHSPHELAPRIKQQSRWKKKR